MEKETYDLSSDIWKQFDESLKALIKSLLCPNEIDRISAKEAKNSEWIRRILA